MLRLGAYESCQSSSGLVEPSGPRGALPVHTHIASSAEPQSAPTDDRTFTL